jgi:myo-inositol-1(or 4)-monophosphatase
MSASLPGGMTAEQLDEIYQFAIDLGKKAGQKLLDGMHSRMTGNDTPQTADANTSNNLAFTEKDNAVDIVTQVDEGWFSTDAP